MIKIQKDLKPADLKGKVDRVWELSGPKIWSIARDAAPGRDPQVTAGCEGRVQLWQGPGADHGP